MLVPIGADAVRGADVVDAGGDEDHVVRLERFGSPPTFVTSISSVAVPVWLVRYVFFASTTTVYWAEDLVLVCDGCGGGEFLRPVVLPHTVAVEVPSHYDLLGAVDVVLRSGGVEGEECLDACRHEDRR